MVDNAMRLPEGIHPNKESRKDYALLIGIDDQKKELLKTLEMLLDKHKLTKWEKKFHPQGLPIMGHLKMGCPLIILSGEVGCGKTALALSVGTPLAELLGKPVKVFETPSNIRGGGLVGEISNRITEVFESVKARLKNEEPGILIIDEADDLATSREQNQAHHEDRAGLNVLIKQLDSVGKSQKRLAVIMITNRMVVLDPAIKRRTAQHLIFERPSREKIEELITWLLPGTESNKTEIESLVKYCTSRTVPYSYSDLVQRVGKQALYTAIEQNVPYTITLFKEVLEKTEPTPLLGEQRLN